MTRDLDMPHIGWVVRWPNIIMLHQAGGVEIRYEWSRRSMRRISGIGMRIVQFWIG